MAKTRHIQRAISRRSIDQELLGVVEQFGTVSTNGEKLILNRVAIKKVVQALDRLRSQLLKLEKKGGVVLVELNGLEITTYRLDSFDRTQQPANDQNFF